MDVSWLAGCAALLAEALALRAGCTGLPEEALFDVKNRSMILRECLELQERAQTEMAMFSRSDM